ncbi:MAG: phosphoenolpyruvate carboxykinase (ATP), partial [Candidatus Aminicenantes bacterium]|nr:phosphoenolpyruvate carboxykinase (ATP) [Candidatus Aminicenantes bacterium]
SEIDWDSPNNNALTPEVFESLLNDALEVIKNKEKIYITNRVVGADSSYALPVRTITDNAIAALFTDNMFRAVPGDISKSVFNNGGFTLITLPDNYVDHEKYLTNFPKEGNVRNSDLIVVMDFVNKIGLVYGSAYLGSIKKLIFTVMNYMLPAVGVLPLHASANEGMDGSSALLLGLSGTGKTTLSADPKRALLGDDEHGWNDTGIANFENGCYAKLIDLDPEKEPEIYDAIMHKDDYLEHGSIVENALMYPSGNFDFYDSRLTQNSRGSYPLSFLANIKKSSMSGHPKTILFLTADANGVLPPVAKLDENQAMLWFLMGYTSKLAGTETGIVDPVSTFSRFFGEPFMPRNPEVYASMLGEKMKKHGTKVFLINTGWSGGPYGIGKRMDINITRAIVNGVLDSNLENIEFYEDKLFHFYVPQNCPKFGPDILHPEKTWNDKEAFKIRAEKLASDFSNHFDKVYGNKNIDPEIVKNCPGK